jgi:hypothetical protein
LTLRALCVGAVFLFGSAAVAEPAATLVAFRGGVRVTPAGGAAREAKVDDPLGAADVVSVPAGGFALLQLVKNGYVVRLDEDLELAVQEVALFNSPKTSASLKQQLDALLSKDERKGINERMTGFYATAAAAETRAAERSRGATDVAADDVSDAKAPAKTTAAPPAPPTAGAAPAGAPAAASQKTQREAVAPLRPRSTGAPVVAAEKKKAFAADAEAPRRKASVAQTQGAPALPAWLKPASVRACLVTHVKSLGVNAVVGDSLTVYFKGRPGAWRIQLEGAVPVPQCLKDAFDASTPPPSDAWQQFDLAL